MGRQPHPLFPGSRATVAYLCEMVGTLSDVASEVPRSLWDSVRGACARYDCNLLAVVAGERPDGYISVVHHLLPPEMVNGYLLWSQRKDSQFETMLERFATQPVVCLSVAHAQRATLYTPNVQGMRELMQHLLVQHGYRRIAFIRGPAYHPAAQERYAIYCEALAQAGIEFDPRLVTDPRPWYSLSGHEGVAHLLDQRQLRPGRDLEVIVCASDRIAMGAFSALQQRGIVVPDQLALTGFNNLQEAQGLVPSLTTVAANFNALAAQAVNALLEAAHVECMPLVQDVASQLVLGESCGCPNPHLAAVRVLSQSPECPVLWEPALLRALMAILRPLKIPLQDMEEQLTLLCHSFQDALAQKNPALFMSKLTGLLRVGSYMVMDQMRWQDALSELRHFLPKMVAVPEMLLLAESILDMARVSVADYYARGQVLYRQNELRQTALLRWLGAELGLVKDDQEIRSILTQNLPLFGVDTCWLVRFAEPVLAATSRVIPRQSVLLFAMEAGEVHPVPAQGQPFPSEQLVPAALFPAPACEQRRTFLLFPLIYDRVEFGYILFGLDAQETEDYVYSTLAESLAGAMHNAQLHQDLLQQQLALEQSLSELQTTQRKLIDAEKMVAIGELVAGVAHEINTPIGIGVTLVSAMAESLKRLEIGLEQSDSELIQQELGVLVESASVTLRNLERAAGLVDSFKLVAVDQVNEEIRDFELAGYIQDVIRSMDPYLRKGRHRVRVDCAVPLILRTYPGSFAQIFTNLVMNSIIHGFEGRTEGEILVGCWLDEQCLCLDYRDNGKGMSEAVREKIFNPFFTTRRGRGGTGLGMHIVYNLVTQRLGGEIDCYSTEGEGTRFLLRLPLSLLNRSL